MSPQGGALKEVVLATRARHRWFATGFARLPARSKYLSNVGSASARSCTWSTCLAIQDSTSRRANQLLKSDGLYKLELHLGSRRDSQCAGGMSVLRLARCPHRAARFNAVGLYRDIASVHRNGREFYSERLIPTGIVTRRFNLSEHLGASFQ